MPVHILKVSLFCISDNLQEHEAKLYYTHTHIHTQPFCSRLRFCSGLPGWAGTRKVKPIWIYWSKR